MSRTHAAYLPLTPRRDDGQPPLFRLTDDPASDWQPSLASDGRLAFTSDRSGRPEVYVQLPGDVPLPLAVAGTLEADRPLYAADGRLAFAVRSRESGWDVVVRLDDVVSFPLGRGPEDELQPAISPDGRSLA